MELVTIPRELQTGADPAVKSTPTPTRSGLARRYDFATFTEALDYAALGSSGLNFYSGRLELLRALSYRELRKNALLMAQELILMGFKPGDRVALVAETSANFVIAFSACQYGGFIPAPLPLPPPFGGHGTYASHVRAMVLGAGAKAIISPEWTLPWIRDASVGLGLTYCGTTAAFLSEQNLFVELPRCDPAAISYLQFSSGSTRTPTGIAITHSALASNAAAIIRNSLKLREDDRVVSWLPFYHDMGLVGCFLSTLFGQLSVDYLATRDFARRPLGWLRLLSQNGSTITYSSTFGYDLCARRVSTGVMPEADLSRWRVAGIGGDVIRPRILENFAQAFAPLGFKRETFVPSYGLAEATLAVSFGDLGRGAPVDRVDAAALETQRLAVPAFNGGRVREFTVCGKPIAGHRIEIRDEAGKPLDQRNVGRIFVCGPSIMHGYDRKEKETAAVLSKDGWLDTGDLGYFIGDDLVVTGRSKEIILVNGRDLWPQDIEGVAETTGELHPGDAIAFGVERTDLDTEQVVVLVQCRQRDTYARDELVAAIKSTINKQFGVAVEVVLVPHNALPVTSSGKLRRRRAHKDYLAGKYAKGAVS